jgi:hypothetical protein
VNALKRFVRDLWRGMQCRYYQQMIDAAIIAENWPAARHWQRCLEKAAGWED